MVDIGCWSTTPLIWRLNATLGIATTGEKPKGMGKVRILLVRAGIIIEKINRVMYWLSALAILLSSLVLTYEVIMRYFLKIPTIWEVETAVYLGIFATFMGAAYGLKDGAHINIDLLTRILPLKVQRRLMKITSLLSLFFCLFAAYKGWGLFWEAYIKGWRSDSLWGPPLSIPYFFLPLGLTLLSLQFIIQIFDLGKARDTSSSR
jgi:TRAP-type C4-dicarboxylate transport system permease small subunit